ncbi:hypothetical protein AB0I81_34875 [Nonomuraea sp. NPDC050404]|uniref:hypothetical protein n=1 Tax=Nonomuraea sp. NPDC050404 TaxID=3155783 RepID=UPI0033E5D25E
MADLGLLQAWGMWFDNVQVNQHTLYGCSILALGRAGKIAAFLGGATAVLDALGPERVRQWAGQSKDFEALKSYGWMKALMAAAVLAFAWMITYVPVEFELLPPGPFLDLATRVTLVLGYSAVLLALALSPRVAGFIVRGFATLLERPSTERAIRWSAVALIAVGFHFDLLAS